MRQKDIERGDSQRERLHEGKRESPCNRRSRQELGSPSNSGKELRRHLEKRSIGMTNSELGKKVIRNVIFTKRREKDYEKKNHHTTREGKEDTANKDGHPSVEESILAGGIALR